MQGVRGCGVRKGEGACSRLEFGRVDLDHVAARGEEEKKGETQTQDNKTTRRKQRKRRTDSKRQQESTRKMSLDSSSSHLMSSEYEEVCNGSHVSIVSQGLDAIPADLSARYPEATVLDLSNNNIKSVSLPTPLPSCSSPRGVLWCAWRVAGERIDALCAWRLAKDTSPTSRASGSSGISFSTATSSPARRSSPSCPPSTPSGSTTIRCGAKLRTETRRRRRQ